MNCFTHALPFLDRPVFLIGCCVPDWLSAIDRKCRAREKLALEFVNDKDPFVAQLAQGVIQHHRDDDWFHQTRVFTEMNMQFAIAIRKILGGEAGFRPGLLGHILIELLLDAYLAEHNPGKLEFFYDQVASVDAEKIQDSVNRFTTKPIDKFAWYIEKFLEVRYIFDYLNDQQMIFRVNYVLKRVKLDALDDKIMPWLPTAREHVYDHASELLAGYRTAV